MRKVSYLPLWHLLLERGMNKSQLRIEARLTTNVLAISLSLLLSMLELQTGGQRQPSFCLGFIYFI